VKFRRVHFVNGDLTHAYLGNNAVAISELKQCLTNCLHFSLFNDAFKSSNYAASSDRMLLNNGLERMGKKVAAD
jgi:hypothetical protein